MLYYNTAQIKWNITGLLQTLTPILLQIVVGKIALNYNLSRPRVVTENSFGKLKGQWMCLLKRNDVLISRMPTVVAVCVV